MLKPRKSSGRFWWAYLALLAALLSCVQAPATGTTVAPAGTATSGMPALGTALSKSVTASPTATGAMAATPTRKASTATAPATHRPANFDYFVLALSWSPDYCASNGENDPQQCSLGKKLGFVLHGLWPQYRQGYPSNCSTERLPQSVKDQFAGLFPSDTLYVHEWVKHGTCSGLSPADYLAKAKQVKESVQVPPEFKQPAQPFRITTAGLIEAFVEANPLSTPADYAVYCSGSGRFLKELYVCFTKNGAPMACGSDVRKEASQSCQAADFLVRNTR